MNIRDVGYVRVVDIEGNTISQQDIKSIKNLFREKDSKQRIGINLKQVDYINENWHGGITFSKKSMGGNLKNVEGKWIGWDYAHFDDYTDYFPYGKKYTTEEIVREIKSIIDKL